MKKEYFYALKYKKSSFIVFDKLMAILYHN